MRLLCIAAALSAPLLFGAMPAAAQSRAEDAVRALNDPMVQEGASLAVGMIAGIILDTKVGALAPYDRSIRPNDTLRDVQRRTDPHFEARLRDGTRNAVAKAGAAAGATTAMAGEFARTADRLRAAIAPLAGLLDNYRN